MSIETANAARFEKGMMPLSPLESELLEALEGHCEKCEKHKKLFDIMNGSETLKYSCEKCSTKTSIESAHGETP